VLTLRIGCPEESNSRFGQGYTWQVTPDERQAKFPFDTKLRVLVENLVDMRARDPSGKCLVFSQYEKSLKVLAALLAAQHFQTRIIGASVSVEKRQQALDLFQTDPPTTILLITSRSEAVGLTLTVGQPVACVCVTRISLCHLVASLIHYQNNHGSDSQGRVYDPDE